MLIRTEAPADILPIDALLKSAFETEAEASLVMSLRENSRFTLSLVACTDEGKLIGYALFTPVSLNGEHFGWQGLAPIAVKQEFRRQGIAGKMIKQGLDSLYEFGYLGCAVLGDPEFYSRFGFIDATEFGMHSSWDVPQGVFRVRELTENEFAGKQGLLEYSPEFSEL
ncbi:GNAT family N-acetyltransferase [Vibrio sp. MA40-2]|uniref:GNAT family N-acetyltransferase n=1 Tax=Vibrio sp. MA40-2 TaxID=3391828 RepID=UPI0039A745F5